PASLHRATYRALPPPSYPGFGQTPRPAGRGSLFARSGHPVLTRAQDIHVLLAATPGRQGAAHPLCRFGASAKRPQDGYGLDPQARDATIRHHHDCPPHLGAPGSTPHPMKRHAQPTSHLLSVKRATSAALCLLACLCGMPTLAVEQAAQAMVLPPEPPRLLDGFEDASPWRAVASDQVSATLRPADGVE